MPAAKPLHTLLKTYTQIFTEQLRLAAVATERDEMIVSAPLIPSQAFGHNGSLDTAPTHDQKQVMDGAPAPLVRAAFQSASYDSPINKSY